MPEMKGQQFSGRLPFCSLGKVIVVLKELEPFLGVFKTTIPDD